MFLHVPLNDIPAFCSTVGREKNSYIVSNFFFFFVFVWFSSFLDYSWYASWSCTKPSKQIESCRLFVIQLAVTSKLLIHLLLLLYDEVSYSSVFYSFSFQWFVVDLHFYWLFYGCCLFNSTWYAPATYIFAFGSLSWISWMLPSLCNIQFRFKCIFLQSSKSQFEISQICRHQSLVFDLISFLV